MDDFRELCRSSPPPPPAPVTSSRLTDEVPVQTASTRAYDPTRRHRQLLKPNPDMTITQLISMRAHSIQEVYGVIAEKELKIGNDFGTLGSFNSYDREYRLLNDIKAGRSPNLQGTNKARLVYVALSLIGFGHTPDKKELNDLKYWLKASENFMQVVTLQPDAE